MLGSRINPVDPPVASDTPQRLGELLVTSQLITRAQLEEGEAESAKTGEFLSKILVQKNITTQDDINTCFVKQCKIPHISLADYDIGAEVLKLVPRELCQKYGLIPIDKLGRILTIAMVDPLDRDALALVEEHCPELRIKRILCNWNHFEQASAKYFAASSDKSDNEQNSMASFGLSKLPPAKAPAPTPAPAADAPSAAPPPAQPAAVSAAPAIDTQALVGAIQAGLRGVLEEFSARTPTPESTPPIAPTSAPAFSPEVLGDIMRDSIREAMSEALQSMDRSATTPSAEGLPAASVAPAAPPDWSGFESAFRTVLDELKETLRPPVATVEAPAVAVAPPPPDTSNVEAAIQELIGTIKSQTPPGEAMGELIRDNIGIAMQEAMASVVVQLRAVSKPEQPQPSFEALAESIRDGIGDVMQETLATLAVQLRANAGPQEGTTATQEAILAALRETQLGVTATMREVLQSSQEAQEAQGAKLAELAEAAVQSTQQTSQLVEASLVQNERYHNLRQGARARHASVSPFGATGADNGEGSVHAEADEHVRNALDAEVPLESLTFDSYYPGAANAFSVKIAQSVAAAPGGEYNPFFLFGNVGLGKTHLISAMGNHIQTDHPNHRVGYVSASHFSRRLKEALVDDAQDAFRENYCHWDVLILDDIQFLGGRVEAQEEFFHIFNVLHQQGRQIIIASDKAPDRLGLLEQRLISRFSSGIVAELKPPEWETRMKILKHHIAAAGASVPEEICSLIAMRVSNDIRKMVGSLRKVVAFAALVKEPITVEMTTEILSHIGGEEAA